MPSIRSISRTSLSSEKQAVIWAAMATTMPMAVDSSAVEIPAFTSGDFIVTIIPRTVPRSPPRGAMPPATPGAGAASGGTIVVRIDTNQGISGYGQAIGDGPQPNYILMHKARLLGENPCNVDRIFRKIKLHGGYNRQGSGVNAIENALWDLCGQAYGVPVYQLLGGKFRDKIRLYSEGDPKSNSIADIAADYKERVASGFTMLKYDLPVAPILRGKPGTIYAPAGYYREPGDFPPENYYEGLEISDK